MALGRRIAKQPPSRRYLRDLLGYWVMITNSDSQTRCVKCPPTGNLFCPLCSRLVDPAGLATIRLAGFTGPSSLVPSVERFWLTGDPEGL